MPGRGIPLKHARRRRCAPLTCLLALGLALPARAAPSGPEPGLRDAVVRGHAPLREQQRRAPLPRIAIVIDDLGHAAAAGWRAVQLPGPVACAFLPAGPHSGDQALRAHELGKEVLLHLPLQPHGAAPRPAGLGEDSRPAEYRAMLRAALAAVPHVRGVNNHQGSLLTERARPMAWLMAELRPRALYFLDSRTSARSVAFGAALAGGLPALRRDVFLDARRGPAAVAEAFGRLARRAHRHGQAVAIGHPYPETLALLERELPRIERHWGVRLVAPSALLPAPARPRLRLSPALTPATTARAPARPGSRTAAAR